MLCISAEMHDFPIITLWAEILTFLLYRIGANMGALGDDKPVDKESLGDFY